MRSEAGAADSRSSTFSADDFKAAQRRVWNDLAAPWATWGPSFEGGVAPLTASMVKSLRLGQNTRVLDVGCGIGDTSLEIARELGGTGSVLGLDQADAMVDFARLRARAQSIRNVTFIASDAETFDYAGSGPFDAAICRFTLMLLPNQVDALKSIRKGLRPGAPFAISTWSKPDRAPVISAGFGVAAQMLQLPPPTRGSQAHSPSTIRLSQKRC